ncbi:MAG: hypothetical protein WBQ69_06925 [Gallionella sp.]
MKRLRILPGAAGIIALTATIGFVDGQREAEPDGFTRDEVTHVRVLTYIGTAGAISDSPGAKPDGTAYLVNITRGEISKDVIIDAVTGKIMLS